MLRKRDVWPLSKMLDYLEAHNYTRALVAPSILDDLAQGLGAAWMVEAVQQDSGIAALHTVIRRAAPHILATPCHAKQEALRVDTRRGWVARVAIWTCANWLFCTLETTTREYPMMQVVIGD